MSKLLNLEFRVSFYGKATLTVEDDTYHAGETRIHPAIEASQSEKLMRQYLDGCTMFRVTKKQAQRMVAEFTKGGKV